MQQQSKFAIIKDDTEIKHLEYLQNNASLQWAFYGFKLHLVINEKGEFIALKMTKGNVDDRVPVHDLTRDLMGYADKGYIKQNLFI